MQTVSFEKPLRIGAAAAYLGVSVETLRRWTDAGKLPCSRTPGNERRYRPSDLDAAMTPKASA